MKQDYWDQVILEAARKDEIYQDLLTRCIAAEDSYLKLLITLPSQQREQLENYISLCEELEHRKTVLACSIPRA